MIKKKVKNYVGEIFSGLIVIKEIGTIKKPQKVFRTFLCKCVLCENEYVFDYKQLINKNRKNRSAGCKLCVYLPEIHSKHNKTGRKTPTYMTYCAMRDRCVNPNHTNYKHYGGRNIKICDRWLGRIVGFKNFLEDMGERPPNMTLDRIDVNGDYEPSNCKWSTQKEQMANRRNNISKNYLEYSKVYHNFVSNKK